MDHGIEGAQKLVTESIKLSGFCGYRDLTFQTKKQSFILSETVGYPLKEGVAYFTDLAQASCQEFYS